VCQGPPKVVRLSSFNTKLRNGKSNSRTVNCIMIIRSLTRVQLSRVSLTRSVPLSSRSIQCRQIHSTGNIPSMGSSAPSSQASMLATITTDLDKIAPRFEIQSDQIHILKTPSEFYETLKVGYVLLFCFLSRLRSSYHPTIPEHHHSGAFSIQNLGYAVMQGSHD